MKKLKQWYIVYVQAGNELKMLHTFRKKSIECFCPMSKSSNETRHKNIVKPLLPNYLFVYITSEEQTIIRGVDSVVNFMYWLGEEVVVNEEDIYTLKELTEKYQIIAVEKIRVNATIPCTKEWVLPTVNSDSYTATEEDVIRFAFPAYGFAVTAKESKVSVRVINIDTSKSWRSIARLQYSK